VTPRSCEMEFH